MFIITLGLNFLLISFPCVLFTNNISVDSYQIIPFAPSAPLLIDAGIASTVKNGFGVRGIHRGKVGGAGVSSDVSIARAVHGNALAQVIPAAAEIGGVNQATRGSSLSITSTPQFDPASHDRRAHRRQVILESTFLVLLIAAGFVLRLWPLSKVRFWDETVYLQNAEVICCGKANYSELDSRPPVLSLISRLSIRGFGYTMPVLSPLQSIGKSKIYFGKRCGFN